MKKYILFSSPIIIMLFMLFSVSGRVFGQMYYDDGKYFSGMNMMDWKRSVSLTSVSGKVIIDSSGTMMVNNVSRMHKVYYLDTLQNGSKDLILYFGPYWYTPANGPAKPVNGQVVTLTGIKGSFMTPPMFAVYTIDGSQWRPSTGIPPWYKGVLRRSSIDTTKVYCSTDSLSYFGFAPGSMGSGMMGNGMMWSDSLCVELFEMRADSLKFLNPGDAVMGFHSDSFFMNGTSMMSGNGYGMMSYMNQIKMRFHVNADSLMHRGISMGNVVLKYLDTDNQWKAVSGQSLDTSTGIISVSSSALYPYYAIVPASPNAVEKQPGLPTGYELKQNYPNPFNPSTNIYYSIPKKSNVSIKVFNIIGQEVADLVNGAKEAGTYTVSFNAADLPSGIYLYELKTDNFTAIKKMLLLK